MQRHERLAVSRANGLQAPASNLTRGRFGLNAEKIGSTSNRQKLVGSVHHSRTVHERPHKTPKPERAEKEAEKLRFFFPFSPPGPCYVPGSWYDLRMENNPSESVIVRAHFKWMDRLVSWAGPQGREKGYVEDVTLHCGRIFLQVAPEDWGTMRTFEPDELELEPSNKTT